MRLRIRFSKLGKVRWTSQRDTARIWERALRRAGVPLAYSEGFSPRPRLSFGLALPTGCESVAEYLDVIMSREGDPEQVTESLRGLLPAGIEATGMVLVSSGMRSLQEIVTSCTWDIEVPGSSLGRLQDVVERTLQAETLPVTRERKGCEDADDLRPSVIALRAEEGPSGGSRLLAELGTRPRGVRPVELARVIGLDFGLARRTGQWIECQSSRLEPMAKDVIDARSLERAS